MAEEKTDAVRFQPEIPEPFEEGFNIKAIIAALFIGFIMLPGAIYLSLITGGGLGGAAQWVTVILLVEIAKRSFVRLKTQEVYIVYIMAASLVSAGLILGAVGLTLQGGAFGDLIWKQYLIQSPYAESFGLTKEGVLPRWAMPPLGSDALVKRTFFHRDWAVPILLLIVHNVLFRINRFSLGYVFFRITSDKERLPFPMAPVAAEGAIALADASAKKETWRWRIFSIAAMIGVIYGAFYVVVPSITGLFMAKPIQLIPIPWVDLTERIGEKFPASMLGYFTDLGTLFAGFVLPFWIVVGAFISCFCAKTVMNPVLYKLGMLPNWQPGMTANPTQLVSTMGFWMNVIIGGAISVGLIGIWKMVAAFVASRKREAGLKEEQLPPDRGDYPIPAALAIWAISTAIYIAICHTLVPDFPMLFFFLFGFVLTPFLTYASARMFGITGVATGISFPMLQEATFIMSGYKGAWIWFAPMPYFNHGYLVQGFKQLELTRTRFASWYKAEFTTLVIMLFCSFLFWTIIWRMAPIPSATYPFVQRMWPISATFQCLWISTTMPGSESQWILKALHLKYILATTGVALVWYGAVAALRWPIALFYGMIGGIAEYPHSALPMLIGALLGRFYFAKKIGPEQWRRYTPILLAGYACGMGLVAMVSIAVALIGKTIYQLVF